MRDNNLKNASSGSSANRSIERRRSWFLGFLVFFACTMLALLYQIRPKPGVEQALNPPPSDLGKVVERTKQGEVFEAEKPAGGTHVEAPAQPLAEQSGPSTPVLQSKFWEIDQASRGKYLYEADLAAEASNLELLSEKDRKAAAEALLEIINDTTDPGRLQALHLLFTCSKLDDEILTRSFRKALADPDEAFGGLAASILASRNDEQAARVLTQAYSDADAKGRLAIAQLLQVESLAAPLLQQAKNDPDAKVRSAALANLAPPTRVPAQGIQ
jgi:hypothetical protein